MVGRARVSDVIGSLNALERTTESSKARANSCVVNCSGTKKPPWSPCPSPNTLSLASNPLRLIVPGAIVVKNSPKDLNCPSIPLASRARSILASSLPTHPPPNSLPCMVTPSAMASSDIGGRRTAPSCNALAICSRTASPRTSLERFPT